jgi:hypothetical protein
MPLKITKAEEPIEVKQLTACIYAPPGLGKSSLAFTAASPLLLDFDGGSYRAINRKDVVQVSTWADVSSITAEDLKPYKTVLVDTAGRALDVLSAHIISENAKLGRGGALTLQGFGELKSRFVSWTKLVRSFGLDVVLIVHSDEQKKGDELIERLDVQGGSKNEIYKAADMMGRISLANGKRILNFNPTDTAFGKNPGRLPALEIPDAERDPSGFDTFLARVLADTKTSLNTLSETQKVVAAMLADWQAKIEEANTPDDFNNLIPETQKADEKVRDNVKRILTSTAKKRGYEFDKQSGSFKAKEAA